MESLFGCLNGPRLSALSVNELRICLPSAYALQPTSSLARTYPPASRLQSTLLRVRNINPISIAYAFRPRLRARLTLSRLTLDSGTLRSYGGQGFSPCLIATHACICSSIHSSHPHGSAFSALECSPTTSNKCQSRASVYMLEPRYIFGPTRSTSELLRTSLNGWLLLSQHPGCLSSSHLLSHLAVTLGP